MSPAFDASGPLDAPAIMLVHGSVVTRKMWNPQLSALSSTFHVIAPDLPGHGALAHIPFSFSTAVDTLSNLIQAETHGQALVAGISLGGYSAVQLAHAHPDQIAGLVLSGCSTNFIGLTGAYLKLVSVLMKRGWLKQTRAQIEAKTRRMFPPALSEAAEAQIQAGVFPDVLGPSFAEMAGTDYRLPLSTFPGPVLILNGENDKASRAGEVRFLAALQHGRLEHMANAGHACNLDQPAAYNQAVTTFAREIGWLPDGPKQR